jgi:predicted transcriptional regulator
VHGVVDRILACSRESNLQVLAVACYDELMVKVLEDAIEKVKKLPNEQQAQAAEILEQLVADADAGEFTIPEKHMDGVLQGLQQARSGELASDDEMASLWKKWGL